MGSAFIIVIGLPSVIWFLFAGTAAGCILAWGSERMAHQASEVRPSGESNRLALTRIVRALGYALLVTQAVEAQPVLQCVPTWTAPSPHQINADQRGDRSLLHL